MSGRERARRLRQLDAALALVDDRLAVLEAAEEIRTAMGKPVAKERAEAVRLHARRVRLLARKKFYETYEPRAPHPQDFPETPAPWFAYRGPDPTANTALANITRKKKPNAR